MEDVDGLGVMYNSVGAKRLLMLFDDHELLIYNSVAAKKTTDTIR